MTFKTQNLNSLAFQHNDLVRSPLRLTHLEARIFALALACLHQNDEGLAIKVAMDDVVPYTKGGVAYEMVREGCIGLSSKPVKVESKRKNKKRLVIVPLFKRLELDEGTGFLTGLFNEEMREFLLHLSGEFTKVEIETLLTLKTPHAHRLYWILKSWEKPHGTVDIDFEELRTMFLGENSVTYPLWTDFKRYVLDPAKKELHEIGWMIDFKDNKEGRKVTSVTFTIPFQTPDITQTPKTGAKELNPAEIDVFKKWLNSYYAPLVREYDRMRADFKVTEPQARAIVKAITSEDDFKKLTSALHSVKLDMINAVPIKKLGAYTVGKIKEVLPVFRKD